MRYENSFGFASPIIVVPRRLTSLERRYTKFQREADVTQENPQGHATFTRDKRKHPMLRVGQIWVDEDTGKLWQVKELCIVRKGRYPHNLILVSYPAGEMCLRGEERLRRTMRLLKRRNNSLHNTA